MRRSASRRRSSWRRATAGARPAPRAQVDVDLGGLRWSGPGYLDSNTGDAPLKRAFRRRHWSRAPLAGGDSVVFYDLDRVAAAPLQLGLRFGANGQIDTNEPPAAAALAPTRWGIARGARADAGTAPRLLRTLTRAPFYARSLLHAQWLGERVGVMHECLSRSRFDTPWVQAMLPFRKPNRAA